MIGVVTLWLNRRLFFFVLLLFSLHLFFHSINIYTLDNSMEECVGNKTSIMTLNVSVCVRERKNIDIRGREEEENSCCAKDQ